VTYGLLLRDDGRYLKVSNTSSSLFAKCNRNKSTISFYKTKINDDLQLSIISDHRNTITVFSRPSHFAFAAFGLNFRLPTGLTGTVKARSYFPTLPATAAVIGL